MPQWLFVAGHSSPRLFNFAFTQVRKRERTNSRTNKAGPYCGKDVHKSSQRRTRASIKLRACSTPKTALIHIYSQTGGCRVRLVDLSEAPPLPPCRFAAKGRSFARTEEIRGACRQTQQLNTRALSAAANVLGNWARQSRMHARSSSMAWDKNTGR